MGFTTKARHKFHSGSCCTNLTCLAKPNLKCNIFSWNTFIASYNYNKTRWGEVGLSKSSPSLHILKQSVFRCIKTKSALDRSDSSDWLLILNFVINNQRSKIYIFLMSWVWDEFLGMCFITKIRYGLNSTVL